MTIRIRFSLRALLVLVLIACCCSAWIAQRRLALVRHQRAVFAVVRRGGTVEYQSGRYGGNLAGLFPDTTWEGTLFPPRQSDFVERVTFQRADRPFGTGLPGKKGIQWIDPDWSLGAMLDLEDALESFPSLKRLEFSKFPLPRHGLGCIEGLTQLEQLLLSQTQITSADIVHLAGLVNLEYLSLRRTRIDDDCLVHLKQMRQLKTLLLGSTRVGDQGVTHLAALPRLESLWLDNTRLTDSGLQTIARSHNLKELRIDRTAVTNAGLRHLHPMSNLRRLTLPDQNITPEAVERLQQALPDCEIQYGRFTGWRNRGSN